MKTIETKKSAGKAYVFWNGHFTDSSRSLIALVADRVKSQESGYKCSEISEVELFETVEEQVPDVGLVWVFFYKTLIGNIEYVVSLNERDAKFRRNTCKNNGFECSAIKLLREEF